MRILLVEAVLKKFARYADGSVGLTFKTMQEMNNDEFSLVDKYYLKTGFLAFKMDEIELDEIPDENTKIKGQISRSKALRKKIFALHMKKGGKASEFKPFYDHYMDRIDNAVQEELDQMED